MNNKVIACLFFVAAFWLGRPDSTIRLPGIDRSPAPGDGLHVLIVEDRMKRPDLPPKQLSAMMSTTVDNLIRDHGGKKYLYDQNQDISQKNDPWLNAAMKVPRASLPWLIIDNNGRGTSVEMSKDTEEHKRLLMQFIE